jgi:ribosomal protein S18 acetylase RimI-like enzyme
MNYAIRTAAPSDVGALAELDQQVFGSISYPLFVFRQFVDLLGDSLLVGADGKGRVCGYAAVAPTHVAGEGYFISLGVAPYEQGRGLGRGLAVAGLERLRALGCTYSKLTVAPANRSAIRLYTSLGYRQIGEDPKYFGPGEPRLVMRCDARDGFRGPASAEHEKGSDGSRAGQD